MGSQRVRHDWATEQQNLIYTWIHLGFSGGLDNKESDCHVGELGLTSELGRSPGEGHSHSYSCLENHHGQSSLVGYSTWGRKELDMTERLSTAQHRHHTGHLSNRRHVSSLNSLYLDP